MLLIMGICFLTLSAPSADPSPESMHFQATVVDTHNDTMMKVVDDISWRPVIDIGGSTPADFQLDLQKAQRGGLDVAFYAAYTDYRTDAVSIPARTNSRSLALIHALHWTVARNQDEMVLARNLREIEEGVKAGKHVAVAALEGMYQFTPSNSIPLLHQYHDLGVRSAGIVWNNPNALGSGTNVGNAAVDAGLTEVGKEVIREMNRLGIMVDVSHMNERTFFDTMSVARAPVIASHSGVDGVRPHVRNLSDDQLQALKENGGVTQINFWRTTVADVGQAATIKGLADHIDYVVRTIGVDHVGLGSDFDGAPMPDDLPDASYLPNLTAEMVRRGYSREDLEKILGGNALRVMREVEAAAFPVAPPNVFRLTIHPDVEPGEVLQDTTPLLQARVAGHLPGFLAPVSFRILVNGVVHQPRWNPASRTMSLQVEEPLLGRGRAENSGNYHVVTFEVHNRYGLITRETRIIYIQ